jgi:hypothetical protein
VKDIRHKNDPSHISVALPIVVIIDLLVVVLCKAGKGEVDSRGCVHVVDVAERDNGAPIFYNRIFVILIDVIVVHRFVEADFGLGVLDVGDGWAVVRDSKDLPRSGALSFVDYAFNEIVRHSVCCKIGSSDLQV